MFRHIRGCSKISSIEGLNRPADLGGSTLKPGPQHRGPSLACTPVNLLHTSTLKILEKRLSQGAKKCSYLRTMGLFCVTRGLYKLKNTKC